MTDLHTLRTRLGLVLRTGDRSHAAQETPAILYDLICELIAERDMIVMWDGERRRPRKPQASSIHPTGTCDCDRFGVLHIRCNECL